MRTCLSKTYFTAQQTCIFLDASITFYYNIILSDAALYCVDKTGAPMNDLFLSSLVIEHEVDHGLLHCTQNSAFTNRIDSKYQCR